MPVAPNSCSAMLFPMFFFPRADECVGDVDLVQLSYLMEMAEPAVGSGQGQLSEGQFS